MQFKGAVLQLQVLLGFFWIEAGEKVLNFCFESWVLLRDYAFLINCELKKVGFCCEFSCEERVSLQVWGSSWVRRC